MVTKKLEMWRNGEDFMIRIDLSLLRILLFVEWFIVAFLLTLFSRLVLHSFIPALIALPVLVVLYGAVLYVLQECLPQDQEDCF